MDNLIFSVNAVLPLFLVMLFGAFLKKINIVDGAGAKQMNSILFNFALPIKLFKDVSSSDLSEFIDIQLIVYSVSTTILWFFVAWAVAHFFISERNMKGAFVQGSFRSNYAILGLPLINNLLGSNSKAAIITTFVIPVYNILSVLILTIYSGVGLSVKDTVVKSAQNIVRNPLIIGIVAGIAFSFFQIPIPTAVNTSIGYMADLSTPIALISIGASMDFGKVFQRLKPALLVCLLKLVAMPLIFIGIALKMGMPSDSIVILFVMYAAPTAVSSYVMAVNMGSDEHLASNIVLMTSLLSIVTYTIGVYILKSMGMM